MAKYHGEDAAQFVDALVATADTHVLRGDRAEARRLFERALTILERTTGDAGQSYGMIHWGLAEIAREEGRLADARSLLERGLAAQRRRSDRGARPELRFDLARTLREQGVDAARADALAREAAEIWRADGEVSADQVTTVEAWIAASAPRSGRRRSPN